MKWLLIIANLLCVSFVWSEDDRIVGGVPAIPHSSPHIVHLDLSSIFCGGSLIDKEWVLSAAHCSIASTFTVVLGDHDLSKEEGTEQYIVPSKTITHPKYDSFTKEYDIMLIKLKEAATLNNYVQSIPMVSADLEPATGQPCSICGWGNMQAAGNDYPDILRCVELSVVSTSICNGASAYDGLIKETMFCIGDMSGGEDACDGDSGGPAVCDGVLTGVTSWGYGCAYPNFPGVYAKLSYFHDWIEATLQYN